MILFVVNDYKENREDYANGFVHTRVLEYKKKGYEVQVYKPTNDSNCRIYEIDGVRVNVGNKLVLVDLINDNSVDTVCVHFIGPYATEAFDLVDNKMDIYVFVHGNEVLHWYQRIFKGSFYNLHSLLAFLKYSLYNIYNLHRIKKFIHSTNHNLHFIGVSEWMTRIGITNWETEANWNIIPNYVDDEFFSYVPKLDDMRFNFLSIRPYSSGKYANDITVQLILKLSEMPFFDRLHFTIVGYGPQWERITEPLTRMKNVNLINRFLNQDEIKQLHSKNGLFICPTRQDAQGVSMCEAMSSGLVPITINNTAIPEFLPDYPKIGCDDINEMIRLVCKMINDPEQYKTYSRLCSEFIHEKCGKTNSINKEIELVTSRSRK